ncbi:MBL fold metallo-hydrolase [Mycobacterium sp. Y57]|uniref:MBL fold metallo-hydrolase n=1 Tax=Mycolicibacterium xanthum TaxID=2796469 RepID=UPI001C854917|nr:MBL fold metallo-hydrolase [Mycolicibacterium xanthum]MBX7433111.1 MBL fold metallo-hydrolase [Mycolicibacterium xanthum]
MAGRPRWTSYGLGKAIFYSHHHADHYSGTTAIVDPEDVTAGRADIYAWRNFAPERENEFGELIARQSMGAGHYGGAFLPPEERHHHGIGCLPTGGTAGFIPPTKLLSEDTTLTTEY